LPSRSSQRVVERLDAMLGETDEAGRMPTFGKVAVVAVVGNEDGAHHVAAECYQWLNDTGFTIPVSGSVYWVGEAMGSIDYNQLEERGKRNEEKRGEGEEISSLNTGEEFYFLAAEEEATFLVTFLTLFWALRALRDL